MGEVFTVEKSLFCSRTWKVSIAGAPCAGRDSSEMTLKKYWGQIMQILLDHVEECGFSSKKKKKDKKRFQECEKSGLFFFFNCSKFYV